MTSPDRKSLEKARAKLCKELRRRGIPDERVLSAISQVPRERFLPDSLQAEAYANVALPIDAGQTISQPFVVALMTQALELQGEETVLEVGTGSGYQAAVLSQLCRSVVTIERLDELARPTEALLRELNVSNVTFHIGDGTRGCEQFAPYEGILVTAAAPDIPAPLVEQLSEGGRLVIPVGSEESQSLVCLEKRNGQLNRRTLCECRFVKLIGEFGWPE